MIITFEDESHAVEGGSIFTAFTSGFRYSTGASISLLFWQLYLYLPNFLSTLSSNLYITSCLGSYSPSKYENSFASLSCTQSYYQPIYRT